MIHMMHDAGFFSQAASLDIESVDLLPVFFGEPRRHSLPVILATLISVRYHLGGIFLSPTTMRFSMIFEGLALAVSNAVFDLKTSATPNDFLDRSIRRRLMFVSAIAQEFPDRLSSAIHLSREL